MNGRENASLFSNQHQEGFRERWPVVVIKAARTGEEAWHSWLEGDGDPEFPFPGVVNLGAVAGTGGLYSRETGTMRCKCGKRRRRWTLLFG
jgi:hypothetical protein